MHKIFLGGCALTLLSVCGSSSVASSAPLEIMSSFKDAVWFMGCDATDRPPVAQPGEMVMSGNSWNAVRENFQGTKMIFQGRVCPPPSYVRDTVFLIDVSGSMTYPDADPLTGGTCKRLTQLEAFIAALPAGSQFGVVTFEEVVTAASTRYFDTKAALYAELTRNGTKPISDIVCAASGLGYFDVGMKAAKALIEKGRTGPQQKEIVVLSDGDGHGIGNLNDLNAAIATARDLKNNGVTIGGTNYKIQIAGLRVAPPQVDEFMRQAASNDVNGTVMVDGINQATGMNSKLNALAVGILANAKISYGPAGSGQANVVDLKPQLASNFTFRIEVPPMLLDRNQTGYEATINYADTRGNTKTATTRINWVPAP